MKNAPVEEPFMTALNKLLYNPDNDQLIEGTDSLRVNLLALTILTLVMIGLVLALLKKKDEN